VLATSPVLVTPNLGTPTAITLTSGTGLPISTGVSGLGTGVANALAVNTGTSGAFVVNGGALGTPSSGTVTNLTGTASININGTVGATTPNTGAFTTVSASTSVTTPSVTNAGTLALSATGANITTFSTNGTERMRIDSSGNVGIGTSSLTGYNLRIAKNPTGATTTYGVSLEGTVQSDVTGAYYGYFSAPATAASAFTLSSIRHFEAFQSTIGSTSAVTNQYGFLAGSTLTGATNNYGFYSNIASGSNRYNFYANGTAVNYFAGNVGIGSTSLTQYNLRISKTITGNADSIGVLANGLVQSDVTSNAVYYQAQIGLAASAFTTTNVYGFFAGQTALSGGAAITNQHGFCVGSNLTGATNNFGFKSDIASGTGRYNFYAGGTADNYFAGNVGIGTSSPSGKLQVEASGARIIIGNSGTDNYYDGSFHIFRGALSSGAPERMRIDSSGNLGLGVTPSAWNSAIKAYEVKASGNSISSSAANNIYMTNNAMLGSGGFVYGATLAASYYSQGSGIHTWYTAPSGTAGNAISFTQAMTLDASGNLGVANTSPSSYYGFADNLVIGTSGSNGLTIVSGTSNDGSIHFADGTSGADAYRGQIYYNHNGNYMVFGTDGSERARIDSSGNLLVGTTTSTAKLTSVAGSAKIGLYVEGYLASNPTAYIYRDNTDSQYGLWIRHDGPVIGSGGTGYMIQFQDRNGGALGSITSSGTGAGSTAYNTSSDYRLKNFVVPMVGALAKVSLLKPVTFKWYTDNSDGQGFIAHELQEVFPEAVTGVKDDVDDEGKPVYQGIDTSFLVATLTAALQEAHGLIKDLQARVDALEAK